MNRPLEMWLVQVILAMISLLEALLLAYLGYKVSDLVNTVGINLKTKFNLNLMWIKDTSNFPLNSKTRKVRNMSQLLTRW